MNMVFTISGGQTYGHMVDMYTRTAFNYSSFVTGYSIQVSGSYIQLRKILWQKAILQKKKFMTKLKLYDRWNIQVRKKQNNYGRTS